MLPAPLHGPALTGVCLVRGASGPTGYRPATPGYTTDRPSIRHKQGPGTCERTRRRPRRCPPGDDAAAAKRALREVVLARRDAHGRRAAPRRRRGAARPPGRAARGRRRPHHPLLRLVSHRDRHHAVHRAAASPKGPRSRCRASWGRTTWRPSPCPTRRATSCPAASTFPSRAPSCRSSTPPPSTWSSCRARPSTSRAAAWATAAASTTPILARLRPDAPRVAIGYELQLVERVPREPHDLCVDPVVTEKRTIATGCRAREGPERDQPRRAP